MRGWLGVCLRGLTSASAAPHPAVLAFMAAGRRGIPLRGPQGDKPCLGSSSPSVFAFNFHGLQGEEAFHCETCKEKTPATKHLRVHRFPEVLVLHIKRFKHKVSLAAACKGLDHLNAWRALAPASNACPVLRVHSCKFAAACNQTQNTPRHSSFPAPGQLDRQADRLSNLPSARPLAAPVCQPRVPRPPRGAAIRAVCREQPLRQPVGCAALRFGHAGQGMLFRTCTALLRSGCCCSLLPLQASW